MWRVMCAREREREREKRERERERELREREIEREERERERERYLREREREREESHPTHTHTHTHIHTSTLEQAAGRPCSCGSIVYVGYDFVDGHSHQVSTSVWDRVLRAAVAMPKIGEPGLGEFTKYM